MVSCNIVVSALDQLSAEGLLESRRGTDIHVASYSARANKRTNGGKNVERMPPLSPRGMLMASHPRG